MDLPLRRLLNLLWHLLTFGKKEEQVDEVEAMMAAYEERAAHVEWQQSAPRAGSGPVPPPWWGSDSDAARQSAVLASRIAMGR